MNQLIEAILAFLEANGIVRAKDHEVYAYGLDPLPHTITYPLGLASIGAGMRCIAVYAFIEEKETVKHPFYGFIRLMYVAGCIYKR